MRRILIGLVVLVVGVGLVGSFGVLTRSTPVDQSSKRHGSVLLQGSKLAESLRDLHRAGYRSWNESQDDLVRIHDWDEFYRGAKTEGLGALEELIVRRLAEELHLSETARRQLLQLVYEEQWEVTRAVLTQFQSSGELLGAVQSNNAERAWEKIRKCRRKVRSGFRARYRALFSEDELAEIDKHLRNEEVRVARKGKTGGCRVTGVGW